MSYLNFDKEQLINLEYALHKEIIRSNRAGSYISTTLNGCNTRKYHGLLVCPVKNFGGEKYVLLSSLDETIVQNNAQFNLGIHRYRGGTYEPRGHKYIRDITYDSIPKTTYRVGGVVLTRERLLVDKKEQVLIRYKLEKANSPTTLRFRPFLAFRNIHQLSKANMEANTKFRNVENGIRMKLYRGFPDLHMQFSKKVEFIPAPDWYYDIEYLKELTRGYEYLEDLLVPGYFEFPIKKGESIVFAAGTSETRTVSLKQRFTKEGKKRGKRETFSAALKSAASQFIMQSNKGTDIIAGFPWYGSITRQTFISLPGISLALHDVKLYNKVLTTYMRYMKKGLFPDSIQTIGQDLFSVDTPLWFIWALQQYFKRHSRPREIWRIFGKAIKEIFEGYKKTHRNMGLSPNGLIYTNDENNALTWMNSVAYGAPVMKRNGYAVEVNALWFNALCFSLDLADMAGDEQFIKEWKDMVSKCGSSFIDTFCSPEHEHLADVVLNGIRDWSVRPNMVIATALDYSPLSKEKQKDILSITKQKLLTCRGLRTLSPDHIRYIGVVEGGPDEREAAVHQGTVWPWLVQFFAEGYLKIHKRGGLPFIKQLMENFEEEVTEHGIGTLAEMYNGTPPHKAKGAISQAWNVAGVIYANNIIQTMKE